MATRVGRRESGSPLKTNAEWWEWAYAHEFNGLVGLEQAMKQSVRAKVCVDCLSRENLALVTGRALIKSTDYYMCQDCKDYYDSKG